MSLVLLFLGDTGTPPTPLPIHLAGLTILAVFSDPELNLAFGVPAIVATYSDIDLEAFFSSPALTADYTSPTISAEFSNPSVEADLL